MVDSIRDLPDFNNPPLVEVGMSVQFEPLQNLHVVHLGQLGARFSGHFPRTEEYPLVDRVKEDFSPPTPPTAMLQVSARPPLPCVGFSSQDGSELIRVQPDRFSYNWRQARPDLPYPRYESVRDNFRRNLEEFKDFIESEQLGDWLPTQCDIIYVNHIFTGSIESAHGNLGEILTLWSPDVSEGDPPEFENITVTMQQIVTDEKKDPIGRFYVQCEPAYSIGENRPLWKINLSVRGAPAGSDVESVMNFMGKGRETIVRGFTSITTRQMHELWERNK